MVARPLSGPIRNPDETGDTKLWVPTNPRSAVVPKGGGQSQSVAASSIIMASRWRRPAAGVVDVGHLAQSRYRGCSRAPATICPPPPGHPGLQPRTHFARTRLVGVVVGHNSATRSAVGGVITCGAQARSRMSSRLVVGRGGGRPTSDTSCRREHSSASHRAAMRSGFSVASLMRPIPTPVQAAPVRRPVTPAPGRGILAPGSRVIAAVSPTQGAPSRPRASQKPVVAARVPAAGAVSRSVSVRCLHRYHPQHPSVADRAEPAGRGGGGVGSAVQQPRHGF